MIAYVVWSDPLSDPQKVFIKRALEKSTHVEAYNVSPFYVTVWI